jgi:phosphatidylglycerophosphate synthase
MWNIPNTLTLIRLAGIPFLLILAVAGQPVAVLLLGLLLVLTDWLDGVLARALHQQTPLGAKLDTIADVLLGLSLVFCVAWLDWSFLATHRGVVFAVLGSYGLSALVCLAKFAIWPSYHNYLAKIGMTLGSLTGLLLLAKSAGWVSWPLDSLFLFAAGVIALANLEALAITLRLRHPRSNVGSIFSLLRRPLH